MSIVNVYERYHLEQSEQHAIHLNRALVLFYQRRKVDPFLVGLTRSMKEVIPEVTAELGGKMI